MNLKLLNERLEHMMKNKGYGEPEVGLECFTEHFGTYSLILNPQRNNFFKTALDERAKDNDFCDKGLSTEDLVEMLVLDTGIWTPFSAELKKLKAIDDFELFLQKHKLSETDFKKAVKLYEAAND